MKKKPANKSHDCFTQANEQLAEHNTELDLRMSFNFDEPSKVSGRVRLAIGTVKKDSKKRAPAKTVLASFCPFCGVNLEE